MCFHLQKVEIVAPFLSRTGFPANLLTDVGVISRTTEPILNILTIIGSYINPGVLYAIFYFVPQYLRAKPEAES